jgi:hypothetical protein
MNGPVRISGILQLGDKEERERERERYAIFSLLAHDMFIYYYILSLSMTGLLILIRRGI